MSFIATHNKSRVHQSKCLQALAKITYTRNTNLLNLQAIAKITYIRTTNLLSKNMFYGVTALQESLYKHSDIFTVNLHPKID